MLKKNKNILNKAKVSFTLLTLLALSSCSTLGALDFGQTNNSITSNNTGEYIVNVNNHKGGEITVKLGFSNIKSFLTKATTSGSPAKTPFDIKSYKLYLIKNANSTYPIGGDPVSDSIYSVTVNSIGTSMNTVKFKGIDGSGTSYYYVAVIAYDGMDATGNELIKPNNGSTTPWASSSANKGIAVSSGNGINVDNTTLVASPDVPLSINSNLIDALGANIDVNATLSNGGNADTLTLINIPVTYNDISTSVTFNKPNDIALDSSGNVYIADTDNNIIRKFDPITGITSTIAGGGIITSSNIDATDAQLGTPTDIAVDSLGNIYISEFVTNKIRKINSSGVIQEFAGSGSGGSSGDGGQATDASLNSPKGLYVDSSNKVYIVDSINKKIRVVDTLGIITTFAGGGSTLGDNGNATDAQILSPVDVSGDSSGNIYIADTDNIINSRIRKVNPLGIITTFAGTGFWGNSGDNTLATNALISPNYIHADKYGNVYFSDINSKKIRKIDKDGIISTFAGGGASTSSIGLSTSLSIGEPSGISSDSSGNIYFSDRISSLVRKVF